MREAQIAQRVALLFWELLFSASARVGVRRQFRGAAFTVSGLVLLLATPVAASERDGASSAGSDAHDSRAGSGANRRESDEESRVGAESATRGNEESRAGSSSTREGAAVARAVDSEGEEELEKAEGSRPAKDEGTQAETYTSPSGDKSGVTSQAISIPKGSGSIQGMEESFSAQLSTGIATFSVPFSLPAARGGVSPSLGLSYSSAGGTGPAGQGWSVGVPFIARQTDRGLPKYDDRSSWHPEQDRFVFNGGQELVPICTVGASGECPGKLTVAKDGVSTDEVMPEWASGWQYFRPRVEGSFLRFFWSPDHLTWIVQDKSGTTMEIGVPARPNGPASGGAVGPNSTLALERNPQDRDEIYRWHLTRQYDQHIEGGAPLNLVVYAYFQSGEQSYLSDIWDTTPFDDPTTTDLNQFAHHTRLRWEEKPDDTESYRSGWLIRSDRRLVGVDVASKTVMDGSSGSRHQVRRYHLEYSTKYHRSLLTQVQVEGRCATTEVGAPAENGDGQLPTTTGCSRLPPMTFGYSEVEGFQSDGSTDETRLEGYMAFDGRITTLASSPDHSLEEALSDFFDINSDGLPDVLVTAPGLYNDGHAVFFNGAGGTRGFGGPTPMVVDGVLGANSGTIKLSNANVAPLDIDGDGRIDLVHAPKVKTYSIYSPLEDGNGLWHWVGREIDTANGQNVKIDFGKDTRDTQVMDVNFDGLVDVVTSLGTEYQTFYSLGRYAGGDGQFGQGEWLSGNSADIDNTPEKRCVPHSGLPIRFGDGDTRLADMNGDGITDIVRVRKGDLKYWPGRGNGFWGTGKRNDCPAGTFGANRYRTMSAPPQYSDINGSTVKVSDVNGDGLDDLVQIRFDAVDIWLNVDGQSWTKRHILDGTPYHAGFHNRVRITDVNGSGTPDIVYGDAKAYKYIDLQGGKKPYLLSSVENGLGKRTELEYSTSAEEMLAAEATGNACGQAPDSDRFAAAWCSKMPTVAHVVKQVTEKDNITIRGRPPAEYVTVYEYRDPIYEGRQREFRGFARARARRIGDENSPTDLSESVFLLGKCRDRTDGTTWDGFDQTHECAPKNRWKDNDHEALKGLPVETHKMDENGVHLASTENQYTIRDLYIGLDGRAVRHAFLSQTDTLLYDTALHSAGRVGIERRGFVDEDHFNPESEASAPAGYASGMAHLKTVSTVDKFGNKLRSDNFGCVGGSECPQNHGLLADETISQHTVPTLITHSSGWLWRTTESWVEGSQHPGSQVNGGRRNETTTTFDSLGRPVKVEAVLRGTEALQREELASLPAGGATDGTFTQSTTAYNKFGQPIRSRGANGRCTEVSYTGDNAGDYSLFASDESIHTNAGGGAQAEDASNPCTGQALTTNASYDQGLLLVTYALDFNLRPTQANYDQFGRITELYKPSGDQEGLSPLASVKIAYKLPGCTGCAPGSLPTGSRHSIIFTQAQDGLAETDAEYIQSYAYVDGFGRTLVTLSEADKEAEDEGDWIAGSLTEWDQKSAVSKKFLEFFWDGDPERFNYAAQVTTEYGRQRYDAFGRQVQTFDLDGTITLQSQYHALSTDLWDAADIYPGSHQGSYASQRRDGHGRRAQTTERFRDQSVLELRHTEVQYLPTGEPEVITRKRGDDQVVRWMRYDSLGRMVLNVEPNTSAGYTSDHLADTTQIQAWRYQHNFFGDLIATSDARGCGRNFFYDDVGRILGEDYAPCEAHQADYTKPSSGTDHDKLEVSYFYDDASNLPDGVAPSGWTGGPYTTGRAIAVLDRGSASFTEFDGRGRTIKTQTRVAKPSNLVGGKQTFPASVTDRYAPRVYARAMTYDAADREVGASTGAAELKDANGNPLVPEVLDAAGGSSVSTSFTRRGTVKKAGSSYGSLIQSIERTADGLVKQLVYGDAADTRTAYLYDERRRISSVQTYRGPPTSGAANWSGQFPVSDDATEEEPTRQLVLQDEDFRYDIVGNPVEIRDWRDPADWPEGAKPVTKKITYDDLYRAVDVRYEYASGDDTWKSPFAAEVDTDANNEDPRRARPSPHVEFEKRILRQTFEYDWLGNNELTTDDAGGFYDRSLGEIENGAPAGAAAGSDTKPYQLKGASLASGRSPGSLEARYDDAGYMTGMVVNRGGPCLVPGVGLSSPEACNQRFVYEWDEVGRLSRARRWDSNTSDVDAPAPSAVPAADLRYNYDASDQRILKEAVDQDENKSFTVYVFASLELRRAQWSDDPAKGGGENGAFDYEASHWTVVPYVLANGVRLARVAYEPDAPKILESDTSQSEAGYVSQHEAAGGSLHVLFELGDHLGSTSVVLDKATGELVERATYQAYGGSESDYRPERWNAFREDYRFTGKEEDVEVGLQYFGKRYLNPLLGRWISADPLEVHDPGAADGNLYAYVSGHVLKSVDPLGLAEKLTGIQLYAVAEKEGLETGFMPFSGVSETTYYKLRPVLDKEGEVMYYVATNKTADNRPEWVVENTAEALDSFHKNEFALLTAAGNFYGFTGNVSAYQVSTAQVGIKVMKGDLEGAIEALGDAWLEALQDPFWWMAAVGTTVGAYSSQMSQRASAAASAKARAASAQGHRGTSAALVIDDGTYVSTSTQANPAAVSQAVKRVEAAGGKVPHHGACGEVGNVAGAVADGKSTAGGVSAAVLNRSPANANYGRAIPPCEGCKAMHKSMGISSAEAKAGEAAVATAVAPAAAPAPEETE